MITCSRMSLTFTALVARLCRSWYIKSRSTYGPYLQIAGLFPGVNYYLSCWYKRGELGIRAAIFFSAAALAGSFGGLLAAGIAQMGRYISSDFLWDPH
jgi:hypothetical protein